VLEGAGDQEYLACESCGALKPVEPSPLDGVRGAVRRLSDFEARFSHFPIVGLCARCASKKTDAAERGRTRCRFESGLRHSVSAFSPIRPIPAGGTLPGIGRVDMPLLALRSPRHRRGERRAGWLRDGTASERWGDDRPEHGGS
jgi:hypothetical protein